MKNVSSDIIFTHVHPAWKDKADYIFRCKIPTECEPDEWEQMWGKVVSENTFIVCCIPFFLYGLSIGDKIVVSDAKDFEVVEKSENTTIRIWTGKTNTDLVEEFMSKALRICDGAERHSDQLVALYVTKLRYPKMLGLLDSEAARAGVLYEIAENRF